MPLYRQYCAARRTDYQYLQRREGVMVTAVKSAPEGTGTKEVAVGVYQSIHFLLTQMDQWIHDHVIRKQCSKTGLDIVSCSGCKEELPQHFSAPPRTTHRRNKLTPHAHELPLALREQMEEIVTALQRI